MLALNLLYTGVTSGGPWPIAIKNANGRRRWSKLREWLAPGTRVPQAQRT